MEYVDAEGAGASRAAIGAHLASCAACQAIAAEQRGISEHAQAWTVETAPATLQPPAAPRARVLLPLVGAWRPSRFILLAGLTAAAAVLLVFLLPGGGKREREMAISLDSAVRVEGKADKGVVGGVVGGLSQARAAGEMPQSAAPPRVPSVIRTATLRLVAKDFTNVRQTVEAIVSQAGGFVDQITVTGDTSTARVLRGTLRVPGDRLPEALARLRQIGQVVEDTQGSQDVTDQIVDLDARLASARATEKRLTELLRNRTGKLSDVLEVERELARVRLDIERLDAEKTNVGRRVSYATIDVTITEERKAGLDSGPLPITSRIRIAAADGLESALESIALTLLFLLRAGPTLLLWGVAAGIAWVFGRRILRPSA